ncbi:MAG: hypothetical protein OXB99_07895 [Acidimicrobiaceae bacterium]|nr:hypothetical protein [Acidimicrobiaceae bacterium]
MARPKSRQGGRVTPKGTRGRTHLRSVSGGPRLRLDDRAKRALEMLVADVEYCIDSHDDADLIRTEIAVSCTIGLHTTSNWNPHGVRAPVVLAHAEALGTPAGLVIAAGMAVYGPAAARKRARQVLERMRADGVAEAEWVMALGVAEPVGAIKFRDEWDDQWALIVSFVRPDGLTHEMHVGLHAFGWGMAHDLAVTPATEMSARLEDAGLVAEAISLESARELLTSSLGHLDEALTDWWDNDQDLGADVDLRTLVGQRIDTLPSFDPRRGGDAGDAGLREHLADVVGGFVALPVPLGERNEHLADLVVAATMFSQACRDPDVLRWTPPRIEAFVEGFLPLWVAGDDPGEYSPVDDFQESSEASGFDDERLATVESAVPRWLRYVAERRGDDAKVLEANLAAARSSLLGLRVKLTGSPVALTAPKMRW